MNTRSSLLMAFVSSTVAAAGGLASAAAAEVGKAPPPLQIELLQASGGYEATDAATAAGEKPIVFVLIPASRWDRPVGRFLKVLDDKLSGISATAEVRAVWLSGEADVTKEYLPKVVQSLQFQRTTLGVFPDESGPEGWQPGGDVQALVVVAHRGKVTARYKFGSINDTDVPQVAEAVSKALE